MKSLSTEMSSLLDKLYNLRGENSVILTEMDKQKTVALETKKRTTVEKKELQDRIADLQKTLEELKEQGEKLIEVLSNVNQEEFITVLDRLRIDFDPENLVEKITKSLPRTIDTVSMDTKKAEEKLVRVEEEMNSAIATIDELEISRDEALVNQEKLNEYFELSLSKNINVTRDSITSLLEKFAFTEEEQREAAKILMFPEDGLLSYDENLREKERTGKSIGEIIAEARSAEPVVEEAVKIEETEPEKVEIVSEEKSVEEKLRTLLKSNGIDYLQFTGREMDTLIQNYNEDIMQKNISYIQSLNLDWNIFGNHVNLMFDNELVGKMQILLDLGKEPIDLYLNPSVLEKYSIENLENAILLLRNNGLDPKNVPLMAY